MECENIVSMNGCNASGESMLQLEMSIVHSTCFKNVAQNEYIDVSMTYLGVGNIKDQDKVKNDI